MVAFSRHERIAALERMAADGVDVLVIGGGITGVSVAMDAAARGCRVGLVEKGDFASGTSSKSTKLVHGGLRYLQNYDFGLVHEALTERGLLFRNAPWIVKPLGFVLPIYSWNKRPLGMPFVPPFGFGLDWVVQSGLLLYDTFAGRLNIRRHRRLGYTEIERRAPSLKRGGLKHAFLYFDGETDDVRLTLTVLRTAIIRGALAANYAGVTGFDLIDGRIFAARIRDGISGAEYTIPTRHVVNACGVHAQRIEELTGHASNLRIEAAKGVHLVFSRGKIPMGDDAIVLPETDDGRLMFLVPWGDRVLVGTTDTEGGDIDKPHTAESDVDYVLDHCNRYLNVALTRRDIVSTYAGFRPLIKSANSASSAKLSRSHAVLDGPCGMVTITGGKLTTWRKMAEDTVNHLAARDGKPASSATRRMPLDGTKDYERAAEDAADCDPAVRAHLAACYGANLRTVLTIAGTDPTLAARIVPGLPYLMAEVVYACRYEMAMTLDDMLSRRTRLVLEDGEQGMEVAPAVAAVMAAELGWDSEETNRQVRAYRENVALEYRAMWESF